MDDDVVAEPVEFVVGRPTFHLDVEPGHLVLAGRPAYKKVWGQKQFGFADDGAADPAANLVSIGCGIPERDRRLKRRLQRVIADVADEQGATRRQQVHCTVDDVRQISRVREVLNDRVENDGVEVVVRQSRRHVGGLGQHPDAVTPGELPPLQRAGQVADRDRRNVRGDVFFAVRCDLGQHQARTGADLQHASRLQGQDPVHRRRSPLLHLLHGNRITGVTAVPAPEIHAEIRLCGLAAVQVVIEVLPLFDDVGVLPGVPIGSPSGRQRDVGNQLRAPGGVLPGGGKGLLDLRAAQQCVLNLTEFDAIAANLDLLVGPSHIPKLTLSAPGNQVPGSVHPGPGGPERTRHEPHRRQRRTAPISNSHSASGNI